MIYEPHAYQKSLIRHGIAHDRCAFFAGMGTGKTSAAASVLNARYRAGYTRRALVVAPRLVAASVWPGEFAKWDHLADLRVQPIVGAARARHEAMSKAADVYTINYENLPWLIDTIGKRWPFDTVICDESTKLKNFRIQQGTKRAHALAQVAHRTPYWLNLTGTPTPNGLQDLWGQTWFLDKGARLGASYTAFEARWFKQGYQGRKVEALPHAFDEIMNLIGDLCYSVEAKDFLDLPPLIEKVIEIELPKKARAYYDQMENVFFADFEAGRVQVFNEGSALNKCLQISAGAVYTNPMRTQWENTHDEKLDALQDVIDEAAGMPILVAYHFKHDLEKLKKRFPQGRALDKSLQTIEDFNAGRVPLLFVHPMCLHPNTEVLTEFRGWRKIVDVESTDRVFDGVEFVSHSGCVFSGVKPVLDVFGIKMTKNHRLLIDGEWVEAQHVQTCEETKKKARYTYKGNDLGVSRMLQLRGSSGACRTKFPKGKQGTSRALPALLERRLPHVNRLPHMENMERGCATHNKNIRQIIQELRRGRHNDLRKVARLQKLLFRHAPRICRRFNVRSHRQLVGLLQRELQVGYEHAATGEQIEQSIFGIQRRNNAPSRILSPRGYLKRRGIAEVKRRYVDRRNTKGLFGVDIPQESEVSDVYDLVDCGPRNRFVIRNSEGDVFISHNSAGHGLSLQHGSNIICYYNTNWNYELDAQVLERIGPTRQVQSGYNRPVYSVRIIAKDTMEEQVLNAVRYKGSVESAVMERLKRKKHAA